ncbi:MAG: iron(III) transport system substrate-binding protein [Alphaproteobacteria bacterium]|jgi:iron(III) transport system substrate-binding protein|nr:iron(III) transport system substrate-binding protein [Alphaproteobacteria bacterium]
MIRISRSFPRKRESRPHATTRSPLSRGRAAIVALAALAVIPSTAGAQTLAELAAYAGPDRTQRLIDGAKKENALLIYSSMTVSDMGALISAFQAKYGIKAQHWRGSSEDIRNRVTREYAASRYDADLAETAGSDMEAMVREQLFQKIATPVSARLIPQATLPHGQWIATRLSVFAGAYNTSVIKAADAPKTYQDLLHSRFKGKLAIEAEDANWFMTIVGAMGEQKGLKLFKDITAANGMSIRKGHTLLANLVPTGEVPLALTAYSYRVEQLKNEGAPVEIVYLPPVVGFPTGAGIFKRAPHPHAALLFEDFILTDGQKILSEREAVPTDPKVKASPEGLIFVDLPKFMDEGERWTKLFKETFAAR